MARAPTFHSYIFMHATRALGDVCASPRTLAARRAGNGPRASLPAARGRGSSTGRRHRAIPAALVLCTPSALLRGCMPSRRETSSKLETQPASPSGALRALGTGQAGGVAGGAAGGAAGGEHYACRAAAA